jgi:hypothetical protein
MFEDRNGGKAERLGFSESVRLAVKIVAGSLRFLARFPKLVVPMAPVFVLVLLITVAIPYAETSREFVLLFVAIFAAAMGLMLSFGVISQMLKQIHNGRDLSLDQHRAPSDQHRRAGRWVGISARGRTG